MKRFSYTKLFPEGSDRFTVAALAKIAKSLAKEIAIIQGKMRFDTLKLPPKSRTALAEILVDFLLDIESGSGIWAALETYNQRLFGTPLPLVQPVGVPLAAGFCAERLRFLLWNIYPQFEPGLLISPHHVDLFCVLENLMPGLAKILPQLPKKSPIKAFLDTPNDYGWEVKEKLIWLGVHSFMFRLLFNEYIVTTCDSEVGICEVDDFICQHTTQWSGLGVNEILAEILDIPAEQKDELRSWSHRHLSLYHFASASKGTFNVINLVNDAEYTIRQASPSSPDMGPFRVGYTVSGCLVPWRNEWNWSGLQYYFESDSPEVIAETLRELKQNTSIVCRYWKERETMVLESFKEYHDEMMLYYGDDLRVFPNGRAWERDEIRRVKATMKSLGRQGQMPSITIPEELLECVSGVAIYLNAAEGVEIMEGFDHIVSGLSKNGEGVSPDEEDAIRDWMLSDSISPAFIHRVLKEHGGVESIKFAFRCDDTNEPYYLDYLLRCYKGHFYRPRFPSLSIREDDDDDDDDV